MSSPSSRTPLIVGLGWAATAAIAFSIGRLGSSSDTGGTAESGAAATGERARGTGIPAADNSPEAIARRQGQFGMGEDGSPLTVARVTNGQPVGDWMKKLLSQDDNMVRMTGLLRFLEAAKDPADLKAALEAVNLRGDRGSFGRGFVEYSMILEKWTQLDARGAIEFAASRNREERWLGTSSVLRTWTRTDPAAAIAWAQENGKAAPAEDSAQGGPGGPQGNFALSTVISQLAHTDLDRALGVAATETFDRRSRAVGTLASELVSQRGLDGAKNAIEGMAASSLKDGLVSEFAERFASKDARAASEWALALPEGEAKSRALAEAVGEWAKKDVAAAGQFLSRLPATAEGDRSRENYAYTVAEKSPETAIAWASAITDEERRLRAVENVARNWVRQDAEAAKAWIAQSPLPDDVKARVQSPSRGPGGPGGFGGGFGRGRGN